MKKIKLKQIKRGVKRWYKVKKSRKSRKMLSYLDKVGWFTIDFETFSKWEQDFEKESFCNIHAYLTILKGGQLAYSLISSVADRNADFKRSDITVEIANNDLPLHQINFKDDSGDVNPHLAVVRMIRWFLGKRSMMKHLIKKNEVFQLFTIPYADIRKIFADQNKTTDCLLVYGLKHQDPINEDSLLEPELLLWRYHTISDTETTGLPPTRVIDPLVPITVEDFTNPVPPFGNQEINDQDPGELYKLLIASGAYKPKK